MSFIRLERCDGPPCTICGCQDVWILEEPPEPDEDGRPSSDYGTAKCKNCGNEFLFRWVPATPQPARKPKRQAGPDAPICGVNGCDGKGTVRSTNGTVQYRKCSKCGRTWTTQRQRAG